MYVILLLLKDCCWLVFHVEHIRDSILAMSKRKEHMVAWTWCCSSWGRRPSHRISAGFCCCWTPCGSLFSCLQDNLLFLLYKQRLCAMRFEQTGILNIGDCFLHSLIIILTAFFCSLAQSLSPFFQPLLLFFRFCCLFALSSSFLLFSLYLLSSSDSRLFPLVSVATWL